MPATSPAGLRQRLAGMPADVEYGKSSLLAMRSTAGCGRRRAARPRSTTWLPEEPASTRERIPAECAWSRTPASGRRPQIEAALALGASPRQCTAHNIRRSARIADAPVIDVAKTLGSVFLPGAMTGTILAGADPLQAVRLQVVVDFMLLAAVSPTATSALRPPPAACSRRSTAAAGDAGRSSNLAGRSGRSRHSRPPPRRSSRTQKGRVALRPPALCLPTAPPHHGVSSRHVLGKSLTGRVGGAAARATCWARA